jgi:hypothetical protein
MMCIQSLKHRDPLVRENALHILTKMADFGMHSISINEVDLCFYLLDTTCCSAFRSFLDHFKQLIGKKVNFLSIFKEINSRNGFEKDDVSYFTFLSQYMDHSMGICFTHL